MSQLVTAIRRRSRMNEVMGGSPRPAVGGFPYPGHGTQAEIEAEEALLRKHAIQP